MIIHKKKRFSFVYNIYNILQPKLVKALFLRLIITNDMIHKMIDTTKPIFQLLIGPDLQYCLHLLFNI